jgi:transcriptional regulator with XRE-family HTH domain
MTLGLFMLFLEAFVMQGEALRLVRVFHDMNQTKLAERLGISKSYLSELESGKKSPTLELLQKYAETFSMPLSSLLFFAENVGTPSRSDTVRAAIASKALKMLLWIAVKDEVA